MHKRLKQPLIYGIISVLCIFVLLFGGCSKNTKDTGYITAVDDFYNKVITYDARIKRIDPKDAKATTELLQILDDMDKDFKDFADLPVPNDIPEAREHAQNAAAFMTKAVSYYHTALDGEKVDDMALSTAELNYENAVTEIKNVGVALQNADR